VTSATVDKAGVLAPPPIIYGVSLLVGLVAHWLQPQPVVSQAVAHVIGPAFVLCGLVGLPAVRAFQRAGTSPLPWRPATALVSTGPYRFTRNPMYVGFTLLYVGISLWLNTLWPLLLLPLVIVVMNWGVIAREERYLERRFGEEYLEYKRRVRRWI